MEEKKKALFDVMCSVPSGAAPTHSPPPCSLGGPLWLGNFLSTGHLDGRFLTHTHTHAHVHKLTKRAKLRRNASKDLKCAHTNKNIHKRAAAHKRALVSVRALSQLMEFELTLQGGRMQFLKVRRASGGMPKC